MSSLERLLLVALLAAVAFLLGRGDRPLHADPARDSTADSNGSMIAVTGPYQQGVSLLYVIDTATRNLAVYEARGGSRNSGRVQLVAARRIDLDLRLDGFHDDSEYGFTDLAEHFRKAGWTDVSRTVGGKPAPETPGSTPPGDETPKRDGR